ncbi:MAG: integration host factor subunit alpha [Pelagibacterales bacterium]|nr:integration host factor subunit alpha [Pelagibacterales bacterium]
MPKNKISNLKKRDLANSISKKIGISSMYAEKILNNIIQIIVDNLKLNKVIKINNFGSFLVKRKKERLGRNPIRKEIFKINERNVVKFTVAKSLKKKINNE